MRSSPVSDLRAVGLAFAILTPIGTWIVPAHSIIRHGFYWEKILPSAGTETGALYGNAGIAARTRRGRRAVCHIYFSAVGIPLVRCRRLALVARKNAVSWHLSGRLEVALSEAPPLSSSNVARASYLNVRGS